MMASQHWNMEPAVTRLIAFREARDWKKFHRPKELAAALSIEAAELQELFLWKQSETADQVLQDPERVQKVQEEVADIAIFLLLLAHDLKIDLPQSVDKKIDSNEARYKIQDHKGVARKADH